MPTMPASIDRDPGLRRSRAGSADRAVHRDVPCRRVRAGARLSDRLHHPGIRAVAGRMAGAGRGCRGPSVRFARWRRCGARCWSSRARASSPCCSKRRSRCGSCGSFSARWRSIPSSWRRSPRRAGCAGDVPRLHRGRGSAGAGAAAETPSTATVKVTNTGQRRVARAAAMPASATCASGSSCWTRRPRVIGPRLRALRAERAMSRPANPARSARRSPRRPNAGDYGLKFDLVAEGVTWFGPSRHEGRRASVSQVTADQLSPDERAARRSSSRSAARLPSGAGG